MGTQLCFCLCLFGVMTLSEYAAQGSPVPDTGQTECYDDQGRTINCPQTSERFAGQDGCYTINPPSYTKLDANGTALPDNAASWAMIKDNVTGLIWEKKTNKDGVQNYVDPHDADNTYAWYDSDPATNGGDAGEWNSGRNTEVFISDLNAVRFGGFDDWRMPTRKELRSIAMYGPRSPGPAINTAYFPCTMWDWSDHYWVSDTYAGDAYFAWSLNFDSGSDSHNCGKWNSQCARAVHGPQ
jgi:hypothetical protein